MARSFRRRDIILGGAAFAGSLTLGSAMPASASFSDQTNPLLMGTPYGQLAPLALQYRQMVLQVAGSYNGKTVGRGECTDFVQEVLNKLNFPNRGLNWGQQVNWVAPGIIIQMFDQKYTSPDGNAWFGTGIPGQHTAIVTNWVQSTKVATVIHQNWGAKKVKVDTLNLGWKNTGRLEAWQPWR